MIAVHLATTNRFQRILKVRGTFSKSFLVMRLDILFDRQTQPFDSISTHRNTY